MFFVSTSVAYNVHPYVSDIFLSELLTRRKKLFSKYVKKGVLAPKIIKGEIVVPMESGYFIMAERCPAICRDL